MQVYSWEVWALCMRKWCLEESMYKKCEQLKHFDLFFSFFQTRKENFKMREIRWPHFLDPNFVNLNISKELSLCHKL